MNKRTILILLVLAIAVVGFTIGPATAATTTIKMGKYKYVGSKDLEKTVFKVIFKALKSFVKNNQTF